MLKLIKIILCDFSTIKYEWIQFFNLFKKFPSVLKQKNPIVKYWMKIENNEISIIRTAGKQNGSDEILKKNKLNRESIESIISVWNCEWI